MSKTHYATIEIKVFAEKEEINGSGELALSDALMTIANDIEDELAQGALGPYPKNKDFDFEVEIR